jgi:hypothetical protein
MSALATAECLDEERRLGGHKVGFRGARHRFQRMVAAPSASGWTRAGIQVETVRRSVESITRLILTNSERNAHVRHPGRIMARQSMTI